MGYIQTGRGEIGYDKWRWAELDVYRVQCRAGENDPNYDSGQFGRDSNRTFPYQKYKGLSTNQTAPLLFYRTTDIYQNPLDPST